MNDGPAGSPVNDVEHPQVANLVSPVAVTTINGMTIDMHQFAAAADKLGAGKLDVLSIGGYRNARGELVPDYDTVRIERRAPEDDDDE
jgi:hypothetical protein